MRILLTAIIIVFFSCKCYGQISAFSKLKHLPEPASYDSLLIYISKAIGNTPKENLFTDVYPSLKIELDKLQNPNFNIILEAQCFSYANEKNIAIDSVEYFSKLNNYIKQAEKIPYKRLELLIKMIKAWSYGFYKDYFKSYEEKLIVLQEIEQSGIKNDPQFDYFRYTISELFYRYEDYPQAINYALKAANNSNITQIKIMSTDVVGMSYLHLNKNDSAKYWFGVLKNIAKDNKSWQAIVAGNLGRVALAQNNIDSASVLLTSGLQQSIQNTLYDNATMFSIYLSKLNLQTENLIQAKNYLDTAYKYLLLDPSDIRSKDFYKQQVTLAEKLNDAALFKKATTELNKLKTSLEQEYAPSKKALFDVKNKLAFVEKEKELISLKAKNLLLLRNLSLGILALGLLAAYFYLRKRKADLALVQSKLLFEKQQAEQKTQHVELLLANYTESLKEKTNLLQKLEFELEQLQQKTGNNTEIDLLINQLRESTILTNDDWIQFRKNFDQVHLGYINRLQTQIPDLSPAEMRFMVLAKLQLNNKEMAAMLGVGAVAIRTAKSRLRKKLNLVEEGDLQELVNSI